MPNVLYLSQQSAEKALKAFIVYRNGELGKIHDLIRLITECSRFDQEFNSLAIYAVELNPYNTGSRYPDSFLPIPDLSIAESSVTSADAILEFVKSKIS